MYQTVAGCGAKSGGKSMEYDTLNVCVIRRFFAGKRQLHVLRHMTLVISSFTPRDRSPCAPRVDLQNS
jgi:hypothetical protein